MQRIQTHRHDHVLEIVLDRADKLNAFDLRMLRELAEAYTQYEDDPQLRCAVLRAEGRAFTAGLDLAEVGPAVAGGQALFPDGVVDPLQLHGRMRTKPVIMAVQGYCFTIGIELLLASDIRLAASDTVFGQIEVARGIFPFGGATIRLPQVAGWGNAMRWLLTADRFDADEAHRIGLVQQVCSPEALQEESLKLAARVAAQAPLGVQATLASSRCTMEEGERPAAKRLLEQARVLMATEDAEEGMRSFVERRDAKFQGR